MVYEQYSHHNRTNVLPTFHDVSLFGNITETWWKYGGKDYHLNHHFSSTIKGKKTAALFYELATADG